jgi:coproporphyrinogen III oxidase-like Fe-S oxidoreductase
MPEGSSLASDFAGTTGTGSSPNYLGMGANALGTIGGIYSARQAAQAQIDAANNATALQRGIYNDTVARNEPFVKGGTNALQTLLEQLGIGGGSGSLLKTVDPQSVQNDPGYQWAQQQGQQALERQLAARGLTGSGRSLKAASRFNTGNATQFFNDAFNRNQSANLQKFNMLSAPVGWGQASANQTAAAGQQFGKSAGSNMIGAGDARAAGTIAQSNLLRDSLNQGVSQYQRRYDQYGNLIGG